MRTVPRALWGVLVAGAALRLFTMTAYSTVITDYYTGDQARYLRIGFPELFSDPWMPALYPAFLRAVHAVSEWLPLTIGLQHLLGLLTGVILYAAARCAGATPVASLLPAAWVALSGDHLYLEQALLTETLWTLALAAALYTGVRASVTRDLRWLAGAGALLGAATLVRSASEPLPILLAAWAAWAWAGPWRARLRAAAVAVVPAAALLGAYLAIAGASGPYSGLGEMRGWLMYQRVGQFADCSQFTPPDGTRGLCSDIPIARRPGQLFWYFNPRSPAWKAFPALSPEDGGKAGAFARAAITHQPLDYARTVAKDFVRFFVPDVGTDRRFAGSPPSDMAFNRRRPNPVFVAKLRDRYSGVDATPNAGNRVLHRYQAIFRINAFTLAALLALVAAGVWRGGPGRSAAVLGAALGLSLLVIAPLVAGYDARYAVPPAALLTVPAALGLSRFFTQRAG